MYEIANMIFQYNEQVYSKLFVFEQYRTVSSQ